MYQYHARLGLSYLKVKIKSLAEEARIIRKEERKAKNSYHSKFARKNDMRPHFAYLRKGLREHRVGIVRTAARETLLAYGFLRGIPYKKIEPKCHPMPAHVWAEFLKPIRKMLDKYGPFRLEKFTPEGRAEWEAKLEEQWKAFLEWSKQ